MKNLLFYVLQVIICSGILYGYYHLFLRNKRFHQYNRFYLLAIIVLSLLVPAFNIPIYFTEAQDKPSIIYQTLTVLSPGESEYVVPSQSNSASSYAPFFTWPRLAWSFYILVSLIAFAKFIVAINKVRSLLRKYPVQKLNTISFINTQEPGTPYSFFKWMFWNSRIELQSENGQKIFRHELFHIQQKHSWDIILIELLTVLFWINPFYHLVKKELKAIHEFLADRFAIQNSENWQYAELLLIQVLGAQDAHLTNPFFHNQIKRRIAMITTSQNPKYQYLRKIMVLPLLAIVLTMFAFRYKSVEKQSAGSSKIAHSTKEKGTALRPDSIPSKTYFYIDPETTKLAGFYEGVKIKSISFNQETLAVSLFLENNRNVFLTQRQAKQFGMPIPRMPLNSGLENKVSNAAEKSGDIYFRSSPEFINRLVHSIVIIDGVERGNYNDLKEGNLESMMPAEHNMSMDVLTEAEAVSKYGEKGKRGVIEINTNKEGKQLELPKVQIQQAQAMRRYMAFEKVDINATFAGGGEAGFRKYIQRSARYTADAKSSRAEGEVKVQFIVDKEGNVTDIKALNDPGYGFAEEAVRLIKAGGKWLPAVQDGQKVIAFHVVTLPFKYSATPKLLPGKNS